MNILISDALISIERRIQEILDDLHAVQERVCYTYDPTDSETVSQTDTEAVQHEAFEYLEINRNHTN